MSEDEILTIRKVAALPKIAEKTACTMSQEGQLSAFKVRGQWRFCRADIDHQQEMATRLGVTYQAYQRMERPGRSNLTVATLDRIARALQRELVIAVQ